LKNQQTVISSIMSPAVETIIIDLK